MNNLFKNKFNRLPTYDSYENIIDYFKEVIVVLNKLGTPTSDELLELSDVLNELSDQYWHQYSSLLPIDIKFDLEKFINNIHLSNLDKFINVIYTLKLFGCYYKIENYIKEKEWINQIEKNDFINQFISVKNEIDYPWNLK